jgi:hypothetical protein
MPLAANWQPVPLIYEAYANSDEANNDNADSAAPWDYSIYSDRLDSDLRQLLSLPIIEGNDAVRADVNGILVAIQNGDFALAQRKLQQLMEDAEELPEEEKQAVLPMVERIRSDLMDLTPLQQARRALAGINFNQQQTANKPPPVNLQRLDTIESTLESLGKLVPPLLDLQVRPPAIQANRGFAL